MTHWKRLWCWEGLGAEGERDDRGWDGWMASPTQWTRVWVNSGSWWWTGRPGVLRFMGSQRVGLDWATDLISDCCHSFFSISIFTKHLLLSSYFQSLCVFTSEVGLLQTAYRWVVKKEIQSATLFLIEQFSPLTFKIILLRHVLTVILLLAFWLCLLFFSSFSFFPCDLMILFSVIVVFFSLLFGYL